MSPPNGNVNGSVESTDQPQHAAPSPLVLGMNAASVYTPAQIKEFVAQLEVPFAPSVIEWRVINTSKGKVNESLRGQVIPYADQRAYTDRLNALFSPAGWTRKYSVHTSANFQRDGDQKTTAKVFVTCDLTVFGIGSHSATGEEWADASNAGTAAEAQAFKRAAACFGLGRYLYHFTGTWVDLDERKRPKTVPKLAGWATPEGWRQGLRPSHEATSVSHHHVPKNGGSRGRQSGASDGQHVELIAKIEAMAEPLGNALYRGLLKTVAKAWKPHDVNNSITLGRVLKHMEGAERGLRRLEAALNKTGPEALASILHSLNVGSLARVDNLDTLYKIVLALESEGRAGYL